MNFGIFDLQTSLPDPRVGKPQVTPEGADSGVVPANVVEDELDWHNEFVGQYVLTDVRYVRYVGINNMHCMYWKSSKKFADQGLYHVTDSMCINVPSVLAASQL